MSNLVKLDKYNANDALFAPLVNSKEITHEVLKLYKVLISHILKSIERNLILTKKTPQN